MGDWGFKISKPGVDVFTAARKDLVLHSEAPCLKHIQLGRQDFTLGIAGSQTYTHTITTTAPFLPMVYVYIPASDRYEMLGSNDFLTNWFEFTATTLYVHINNDTGASLTSHYFWYIGFA